MKCRWNEIWNLSNICIGKIGFVLNIDIIFMSVWMKLLCVYFDWMEKWKLIVVEIESYVG